MTKFFSIVLGVLLCTGVPALDVVIDGKPMAEIIIAADADEGVKRAAEDLQYHLKLISGAELKIISQPSAGVKNQLFVGESDFTRKLGYRLPAFKNSGYDIVVKDNYAVLAGPSVMSKPSPYVMTASDYRYAIARTIPRPADYPSPGLKAWQDFCGEKFTTIHVTNGGGNFNSPLKIFTNDDIGAWHAVSALLEQLGVRFYAPYENGAIVPEKKTIVLADQHLTREAKFARREFEYSNAKRTDKDGIAWLKRLKGGNYTRIIFNHTTCAIYVSPEQHQLHPEYLAEESPGKLWEGFSGSGKPRYTNPGFRDACVLFLRKVFDAFPQLHAVSMGPPDGGIFMDYRDLATYRHDGLSKEQAASNYVWDFHIYLANELKKTHPDKYLLYMSGMGAQLIFNHIRPDSLPDNIIYPFTQPYSAYRVLNSTNNAVINYRKPWLKLQPKGVKSPIWDYFLYYRTTTPRYPVIFSQSLQQEMQEMETYADGKFIEVRAEYMLSGTQGANKDRIAIVPLMHLMMYVQMKLFWDPELDMKALLEEYYQLYFGPAAAEMKEFHEFAEAVWNRQESRSITSSTGFLKEQDVAQYFEILSRAKEKAGQNSVHYNRIAAMEKEMESLEKLFPNLKRTGPDYRAHWTPQPWDLDGNVDKYKYNWVTLQDNMTAKKITRNLTKVALALPRQKKDYLTVAAICYENKMANLKADCKLNDDVSIFQDDVLEVYINTPERSYFKVVVNSNGAIYDESHDATIVERDTLPVLWNPDCKAVVKKYDDRWTVELMIPTGDFGKLGPTKEYPWGIQVARTRYAGGTSETFSLAPTGGRYDTMNKWGNLWMR